MCEALDRVWLSPCCKSVDLRYYLDIQPDVRQLARYGLTVGDVQDVISTTLVGELLTTTIEGRERFGVIVRYPRELRDGPQRIASEALVATPDGAQITLGELATLSINEGATEIRTENSFLSAYVYVDTRNSDLGE